MNKKVISIVALIALVAILGVCLMACNADSYAKKLEKKGYNVSTSVSEEEKEDGIEWVVVASKKGSGLLDGESVTITKYVNEDDAIKAEETAQKLVDTLGVGAVVRKGNVVISGTEQGVKDAK